ncbi:hypothetical protein Tco_0275559 [Tanacetum coccineum]
MAQQSEITKLQAADRRRQVVITDLLKADYQRQRQDSRDLLRILQSQSYQRMPIAVLRWGYGMIVATV